MSDYVNMGGGSGVKPGTTVQVEGLDDPNLSQEDKDLRLALALQQQENAAVYEAHKKKLDNAKKSQQIRTTRSNVNTGLAAIRKRDGGALSTPSSYNGGESSYSAPGADPLASQLQQVEAQYAGTAKIVEKIVQVEAKNKVSDSKRTGYSTYKK
eukprot:CAMPEP_0184855718 /NCGR_PEP_ID=MMETSP0580-20130426/861_1 /TAXON_ID=1118495 /ORGANISM="Dactyliosolen fragilissimus" /LENGTH=153 /DNA_ID=CAMNT_0027350291 /DNA_START=58 /DNA_END=519 /DNA_ORIENTATION=+